MPWHARLRLHYTASPAAATAAPARTVARFRHDGPLRILQSLYPEGDAVCHNVMVHPPSGLVGGDVLDIDVQVDAGAHGLVTTPGATRFYRSEGDGALQNTRLQVAAGGRLEWLPLEAICYDQCRAENRLHIDLAPGAEMMGWDMTALGLPGARKPFLSGHFQQHIELPGVWLERGRIDAQDALLMDGALGLAGQRCCASLFFLAGSPIERERRQALLEAAQTLAQAHGLLRQVWARWRTLAWRLPATAPRIWAT
ncbi:MAG: Urease accessory protein UreD [Paracidovorax wautersii]|uniref:Urease accessory protein UreD n=1 Tax=Paracidovorax wautersii TaxID=1177982 RepID=A0A7V8JRA4_9BURK|nr:MAG: Urease accessory protein UreD [Paracidovorax wautersii]